MLDEGFDRVSGDREQEEESGRVGQQTRCEQDDAGDQNEDAVEKLFGRHHALLEITLDFVENPNALQAGQIRAHHTCSEDQEQCRQGPETTSDFDEKTEFDHGDHDEHRQQDAEYFHGFMIAWAS